MEYSSDSQFSSRKSGYFLSKKRLISIVTGGLILAALIIVIVHYASVSRMANCDWPAQQILSQNLDHSNQKLKTTKKKITDVRLPTHLKPIHYRVDLLPFLILENFTINGYVEIRIQCQFPASDNITLHAVDIDIDLGSVEVIEHNTGAGVNKKIGLVKQIFDEEREFFIIYLDQDLVVNRFYVLKMKFVSHLGDNLKGFYRSVYKDKKTGLDEYMAVTQFQATDARRAFPCFDEPALKANFLISLGRRKDMSSISNMPIKRKSEPMAFTDEYVWDRYEESVPMSTYLVAFIVSKFGFEESLPTSNGVRFRIWAREDALDQISFAKEIGPKILSFFEGYYNVSYPLPKQDMIAIPDFSAGAMENWGIITYRETALLYKEGVADSSNKQRIAIVVSHELAHQWFGNLVTPSWWTDLWLNEGFASYIEYIGVDAAVPEMKIVEQFVINELQNVFSLDSLTTSHPISIPVKHPAEITEIFDKISYSKGATIIRMMDAFLTTSSFRKGLTNYLKAKKYASAEQDDLWKYLTIQAHIDETLPLNLSVKQIMDTWTLQMGFPVVHVTRHYKSNRATIRQERFLLAGAPSSHDTHDYKWWIPINYAQPGLLNFNDTKNKIWMKQSDERMDIDGMPDNNDTPVIFNIQQTGYFRVNYDIKNWKLIIAVLKDDHTKIHVINRAQIIDDALNLARTGRLDYSTALSTTEYLKDEIEYVPWAAAVRALGFIDSMLKRTPAYGAFKNYMKSLVLPLFRRLGFEPQNTDEHLDIHLRKLAISQACYYDDVLCMEKTTQNYQNWMNAAKPNDIEGNPINVNLKKIVYCNAVKNGDEKEWNFALQRFIESNVATEKNNLLLALSCTKQVWLLHKYLKMSLFNTSVIRRQDASSVIKLVSGNIYGRDISFDFFCENWDLINHYFGASSFSLPYLIKNVMNERNTRFQVDELIAFREKRKNDLKNGARSINQAIEKGETAIIWMKNNYKKIQSFLMHRS